MRAEPMSCDWARLIADLMALGLTGQEIHGGMLSDKMLRHYRAGTQPQHWRGERILLLWCQRMGRTREDAPQRPVVRGHRVRAQAVQGPVLQELPAWPVAVPITPRKKPGPKPKVLDVEVVT